MRATCRALAVALVLGAGLSASSAVPVKAAGLETCTPDSYFRPLSANPYYQYTYLYSNAIYWAGDPWWRPSQWRRFYNYRGFWVGAGYAVGAPTTSSWSYTVSCVTAKAGGSGSW